MTPPTPPNNPNPIANYAIAMIGTIAIVRPASTSMEQLNFWKNLISDWEQIADHLRAIGATHWRSIDPDEAISPLAALNPQTPSLGVWGLSKFTMLGFLKASKTNRNPPL